MQTKRSSLVIDLDSVVLPMCEDMDMKRDEYVRMYNLCLALKEAAEEQSRQIGQRDHERELLQKELHSVRARERALCESKTLLEAQLHDLLRHKIHAEELTVRTSHVVSDLQVMPSLFWLSCSPACLCLGLHASPSLFGQPCLSQSLSVHFRFSFLLFGQPFMSLPLSVSYFGTPVCLCLVSFCSSLTALFVSAVVLMFVLFSLYHSSCLCDLL